jgi:SAM-dependent methyltransferase
MSRLRHFLHRATTRLARDARLLWRSRGSPYRWRIEAEKASFQDRVDVHALPDIFHYWSDTYVRPMLEEFGFSNPEQFFAKFLAESASRVENDASHRFLSIGAGNCEIEIRVARALVGNGLTDFEIECLELNRSMLDRGMAQAQREGVGAHIKPAVGDFNAWRPSRKYSGVMANQSLHHVLRLEHLFDSVKDSLAERALFVVSDIIGRNGHMRWPEALAHVQSFWRELPPKYHYNRQLRRNEAQYVNFDCSKAGFEGIRAQEIVAQLGARFEFELFIGFGNVIDVFVDRCFGHNFDASAAADRAFIDRVHARDEALLRAGRVTPTHMFAVLSSGGVRDARCSRGITPVRAMRAHADPAALTVDRVTATSRRQAT